MITAPPELTFDLHVPRHDLLGSDPEAPGTERFERIMAALDRAADARLLRLPHADAQPERRPALAA
jgi:hypothetical protein